MRKNCQQGMILLEAAVSLPIMILLLLAAGTMLLWNFQYYYRVLANTELHQEVQVTFQRMTEDALESWYFSPYTLYDDSGVCMTKRFYATQTPGPGVDSLTVCYWRTAVEGTHKIMRNDAFSPMTGDYSMAGITILDFLWAEEPGCPGLYKLRLTGCSLATSQRYTLSTAVYLPPHERRNRF